MPLRLMPHPLARLVLAVVPALLAAGPLAAQVKYPAPPDRYHVDLRYRIRADRDERIRQFRAMTDRLAGLGFRADPREDADLDVFDPTAERLAGTVPSAAAGKILDDPRIQTILLVPAGMTLPDDPAAPVQVRVTLASGLEPTEQRLLHAQVVAQLYALGFRENVGYDHRGYTLVRGTLPAGRVFTLLKDLRDQPGGWFVADTPRDRLPLPLRSVLPVRVIEVLPEVEGLTPQLPVASVVGKLTPDLRAVLDNPAVKGKPIRVEAIFGMPLGDAVLAFRSRVRNQIAGSALEGVVGEVVTIRLASSADVPRLAQIPEIIAVRLPRAAVQTLRPAGAATAPTPEQVLTASRASTLHALGYRGAGLRIVVVGVEFPGLAGLLGRQLPKATRFIDLTAENSPTVEPEPPVPGAPTGGIDVAVAAHAAAPDAEVVLVRVDPTAFHQLMTIARRAAGLPGDSVAMQARGVDLSSESEDLLRRREQVIEEYRQAFADLSDEDKAVQRREAAQAAVAKLQADEQAFRDKTARLVALRRALESIRGAEVVVNTLVWEDGFAQDGLSELSQFLDERFTTKLTRSPLVADRLPPIPVWVQAGSDSVGAVWAGPFLDPEGNGVMDFAPEAVALPPGAWTRELNFLAVLGPDGRPSDLAAGTRLRFVIQWREPLPLDPRQPAPVFAPSLRLLRQLDPAGTRAASDEFSEVARSGGMPVRIQLNPASAVYEQTLEVTVPAAGRYALRVEGRTSAEGGLPVLNRTIEVQPRLFVRNLAADAPGRVVFATFAPKAAGVGVPGDSPAALTIEFAAGPDGTIPGGLTGAGPGVTLRAKPDLLAPGVIVVNGVGAAGSGIAAGYAAGISASLVSAGARPPNLIRTIGIRPGAPLVLPVEWLQSLTPRVMPVGR